MSESIFCDICEKVLSQQKGEYDHGCLDCHGQPYANKIFWLRKDVKLKNQRIQQLESALRDMGEALLKIKGKADPSNDGKWHIFEVTYAAYALERHKDLLDQLNKEKEA